MKTCLNCKKKLTKDQKKFCSNKCKFEYANKNKLGWHSY